MHSLPQKGSKCLNNAKMTRDMPERHRNMTSGRSGELQEVYGHEAWVCAGNLTSNPMPQAPLVYVQCVCMTCVNAVCVHHMCTSPYTSLVLRVSCHSPSTVPPPPAVRQRCRLLCVASRHPFVYHLFVCVCVCICVCVCVCVCVCMCV